jgi:hypothetical protein
LGAEISVSTDATGFSFISVEGEIGPGDGDAFAKAATNLTKAAVIFDSMGGSLSAGLQIGAIIRQKGFGTAVPEGLRCASACALAWLAGTPRMMAKHSLIGFHAAYEVGEQTASGVGNAVVGAYLTSLGLPISAVVYITEARPQQMQYLNFIDAAAVGIEVESLPASMERRPDLTSREDNPDSELPTQPRTAEGAPPGSPHVDGGYWIQVASRASQDDAIETGMQYGKKFPRVYVFRTLNGWYSVVIGPYASGVSNEELLKLKSEGTIPIDSLITSGKKFTEVVWTRQNATTHGGDQAAALKAAENFYAKSVLPKEDAVEYLESLYADRINYYGLIKSRRDVIEEKEKFFERWPDRAYDIRAGSLQASCDMDRRCTVRGEVDWRAESLQRNATASGTAQFELQFVLTDRETLIAEWSKVVSRNPSSRPDQTDNRDPIPSSKECGRILTHSVKGYIRDCNIRSQTTIACGQFYKRAQSQGRACD